jgi:hypothetical protein
MKASMAKAARAFDALRIKREAESGAPAAPVQAAPAAEAAPVAEATNEEVVAQAAPETSAPVEPTENA